MSEIQFANMPDVRFLKMPKKWCMDRLCFQQGLVLTKISYTFEFLFQNKVLKTVREVFPELTNRVSVFYLFDMKNQRPNTSFCHSDGVLTLKHLNSGDVYCTIGIATQTINRGVAYCTMVLLHELAHSLVLEGEEDTHSERFYEVLNFLIDVFNRETGATLENDYNQGKDAPQRRCD